MVDIYAKLSKAELQFPTRSDSQSKRKVRRIPKFCNIEMTPNLSSLKILSHKTRTVKYISSLGSRSQSSSPFTHSGEYLSALASERQGKTRGLL